MLLPQTGQTWDVSSVKRLKKPYSFYLGGHLYGKPNQDTLTPSSTLLKFLPVIKKNNPSFFVSLGDNVYACEEKYFLNFKKSFVSPLGIPFFSAIGNHDFLPLGGTDGLDLWKKHFGDPSFYFLTKNEAFIFINDLTAPAVSLKEEADFLKESLEIVNSIPEITTLFVFTHRLIWFDRVGIDPNWTNAYGKYTKELSEEYNKQILPLLQSFKGKTFVASGDIGASYSFNFLYQEDPDFNSITYIATGMGDNNRDNLVKVSVGKKVEIGVISLGTAKYDRPQRYRRQFWKHYFTAQKKLKD